jgi:hypothetical protein
MRSEKDESKMLRAKIIEEYRSQVHRFIFDFFNVFLVFRF